MFEEGGKWIPWRSHDTDSLMTDVLCVDKGCVELLVTGDTYKCNSKARV